MPRAPVTRTRSPATASGPSACHSLSPSRTRPDPPLIDKVTKATQSKSWQEALVKNSWTPALLTGQAFEEFVDRDFANLRAIMVKSGMV